MANGLLATGDPTLRQALINSGYDIPDETRAGSSPKQRWIVILSLLVCVVGIVNAQLMAVTERFREIGTMKCLGALDRFILGSFFWKPACRGWWAPRWGPCRGPVLPCSAGCCGSERGDCVASGMGRGVRLRRHGHRRWVPAEPVRGALSGHCGCADAAGGGHAGGAVALIQATHD